MFIPAVKFGRMSKKQREKVEDEVRLHKQMISSDVAVSQFAANNSHNNHNNYASFSQQAYSPTALYSPYGMNSWSLLYDSVQKEKTIVVCQTFFGDGRFRTRKVW